MKTELNIQTIALNRAIQMLNSIGAKYKIVASDGGEYGTLEIAKPSPPKRALKYPLGSVRTYLRSFVSGMQVGDIVKVPVGEFDLDSLQSNASALCSESWGNKSYITHIDHARQCLEVLRVC